MNLSLSANMSGFCSDSHILQPKFDYYNYDHNMCTINCTIKFDELQCTTNPLNSITLVNDPAKVSWYIAHFLILNTKASYYQHNIYLCMYNQ